MRAALLFALLLAVPGALPGVEQLPSPENQVFPFSFSAESEPWPDGSTRRATAYLWIPEDCARLRGLVIMGANVPEHGLVGHPAIRAACREAGLGLVWSVPTFWRFGKVAPSPGAAPLDVKALPGSDARQVALLGRLLAGLAERSGYAEVATVPWFPVGESGHLLMVVGLVNERPGRCAAALCVKNPYVPRDRTVPMFWTLGTGQEWGQSGGDVRERWRDTGDYRGWMAERAEHDWPLSLIVEPGTGHFLCTDAMAWHFGRYLVAAARARLPEDGAGPLRPVRPEDGVLADLPIVAGADLTPRAPDDLPAGERARAWFFDAELARDAQRLSTADWDAAPQFVAFTGGPGVRVEPFALNSVTRLHVATDGTFSVGAELLAAIPDGFVAAGAPLARASDAPVVEWLCGPVAPDGPGRFRVALDRTWKTGAAIYLVARHEGGPGLRRTVQPAHVTLVENRDGPPQSIAFEALPDVPVGTAELPLRASASSGLPVSFYVESGPAVVRDGRLVFVPLPPRARLPLEVTVVAWQWGRATEPRVPAAPLVRRSFRLLPASATLSSSR